MFALALSAASHLNRLRLNLRGRHSDRGATAVEYGLLVAVIAMVVIGAAVLFGTALSGLFDAAEDCITAPGSEACQTPHPTGDDDN